MTSTGLAFERHGAGEPLLLLHGTGGSRAVWEPITDRLAAEREVLLVDLPGHGASASPPPGVSHTPMEYARTIAALLDELELPTVHVAGNSVGGWTALELAKLGRARSVVALAPAGLWPKQDPWRCTVQLWTQYRLGRLFGPVATRLLRTGAGRTLLLGGTVGRPRAVPASAAVEMARTYSGTSTFPAHLAATRCERFREGRAIDVPVTVAWGSRERLIPKKARQEAELPGHARVVTLENCGHIPMWDDPELVARTILDGARAAGPA